MKQIILILVLSFFNQAYAQTSKQANIENGIGIQGYDPVAYFSNKALKGDKKLAVNYAGVVYYFSTEANKKTFLASPAKYEPQYGGWCAYAMGYTGEKVEVDPKTYKIIDGKLYLFYNALFNNTLKTWNKDEAALKIKADKNWIKITSKK